MSLNLHNHYLEEAGADVAEEARAEADLEVQGVVEARVCEASIHWAQPT